MSHVAYETCGFLGFGAKQVNLSTVCGRKTEFSVEEGKCVSVVDVTSDNASMCDTPGVEFRNGKCVSVVDVTSDNASMCDTPGVEFRNGKCRIQYGDPLAIHMKHMTPGTEERRHETMEYIISRQGAVPKQIGVEASCTDTRKIAPRAGWGNPFMSGAIGKVKSHV